MSTAEVIARLTAMVWRLTRDEGTRKEAYSLAFRRVVKSGWATARQFEAMVQQEIVR